MQTFLTEDQYLSHMRGVHPGSFTEPQLRAFAERNPRPNGPMFTCCPMCGATEPADTMEAHIVHHLRLLAVRSLPPFEDVDAESGNESDSGVSRPSSRSTIKKDPERYMIPVFEDAGGERTWDFNATDSFSPFAPWGGYRKYITAISKDGDRPDRKNTPRGTQFVPPDIFDAENLLDLAAENFQDDPSSGFIERSLFNGIRTKDRRNYEWGFVIDSGEEKFDHVLTSMAEYKATAMRFDQKEQPNIEYSKPPQTIQPNVENKKPAQTVQPNMEYKKPAQTVQSDSEYKKPSQTIQLSSEYKRPYQTIRSNMEDNTSKSKQCNVVDCARWHVYDIISARKIYSSYCQEHTCQAPRNEKYPFCIHPRNPSNRYCAFHGKCLAQGCVSTASRSEKFPFPYICPRHRCSMQGCARPRFKFRDVCAAHLTCEMCTSRPQPGRPFCNTHSCNIVPSCARPALQPGVGHCNVHLPCGLVRGCQRLRMRFRDGRQAVHCDLHFPCAKALDGCRELAAPRSDFCFTHKCILTSCLNPQELSSHYCKRHTCMRLNCNQAIFDVNNPNAQYCSAHECLADRCSNEAKTAGGFCTGHGCAYPSCNAGPSRNDSLSLSSAYCCEHRCHYRHCGHSARINGFCYLHSCIEEGCGSPCLANRNERQCLLHWTRDARKDLAYRLRQRNDGQNDRHLRALEDSIHEVQSHERFYREAEQEQARESTQRAKEAAQHAEHVRVRKARIERERLFEHFAEVEVNRRHREDAERMRQEDTARLAVEDAHWNTKARETERAVWLERQQQEDTARAAAEREGRERARMATEGSARDDHEARVTVLRPRIHRGGVEVIVHRRADDDIAVDDLRRERDRQRREETRERQLRAGNGVIVQRRAGDDTAVDVLRREEGLRGRVEVTRRSVGDFRRSYPRDPYL